MGTELPVETILLAKQTFQFQILMQASLRSGNLVDMHFHVHPHASDAPSVARKPTILNHKTVWASIDQMASLLPYLQYVGVLRFLPAILNARMR